MSDALRQLMATIAHRRDHPVGGSYTRQLLEGGVGSITRKIREEADELIEAAAAANSENQRPHLIHEAADVMYHLCVLLAYFDLDFQDVERELARRSGTSGLAEKASRGTTQDLPP